MVNMAAAYHELGHVLIFNNNIDTQLLEAALYLGEQILPNVTQARTYASNLAQVLPSNLYDRESTVRVTRQVLFGLRNKNYQLNKEDSLFSERYAWAAGIRLVRSNGYPTGFKKPTSYFEYARQYLATYADGYKDERFVEAFKSKLRK